MSRFRSVIVIAIIILLVAFMGGLVWGNLLFIRFQPGGTEFSIYYASGRTLLYEEGVPQPTPVFLPSPTPEGTGIVPTLTPTTALVPGGSTPTPTPEPQVTLESDLVNPYGLFAARNTLDYMNGSASASDETLRRLDLPLHVEMLLFPIVAVDDFNFARAIWALVLEIALVGTVLLSVSAYRWKPGSTMLGLLFLFGLFWLHGIIPFVLGDAVIFSAFLVALAFAAFNADLDELAGGALALATFKFTAGGLFLAFVLLWAVLTRRWRMLFIFVMTLSIAIVLSFFFYPDWFWSYFVAQVTNLRINPGFTLGGQLEAVFPAAGSRLGLVINGIFIVILLAEWWQARRADLRHMFWTASFTLAITPLTGLPAYPQNYALFLPGILFVLYIMTDRWPKVGRLSAFIVAGALFLSLWLVFLLSRSLEALYLPLPLIQLTLLYWVRWWAVRPPRTWADKIRSTL